MLLLLEHPGTLSGYDTSQPGGEHFRFINRMQSKIRRHKRILRRILRQRRVTKHR